VLPNGLKARAYLVREAAGGAIFVSLLAAEPNWRAESTGDARSREFLEGTNEGKAGTRRPRANVKQVTSRGGRPFLYSECAAGSVWEL
jgi:hypothetical protein